MTPSQIKANQPQYTITPADEKRQKTIADAWQAYHGCLEPPLMKMPGQPDDNVLTNRMASIVNGGVDFLFGQELEISLEEGAPDGAQEFLDCFWGRKETRIPLLQKLAMNGAIAGQAYLRIVPSKNGKVFRPVVIDPAIVFAKTSPQDCETVMMYCIQYSNQEIITGSTPQTVYYREELVCIDPDVDQAEDGDNNMQDIDSTWQIQHWTRIGDKGSWNPIGDPILWAYPFPPMFACQNLPMPNEFLGTPDITPDLIGVNNALNLVNSDINRVLKLFGSPIIYATGASEQVIDIRPGKIIGLPTPDSKIVAVTISSDIANGLAFAKDMRSDIDEQASWPSVATGRITDIPRGNVSGIAIELMFAPALKKTDKKRCLYGELIIDVSQALLILGKYSNQADDISVILAWQNPLPHDDLASIQAAIAKKQIGISNTTLQRENGYDPEEELELAQTEDAQTLTSFNKGQGMPPALPQAPAPPTPQAPSPFIGRGE